MPYWVAPAARRMAEEDRKAAARLRVRDSAAFDEPGSGSQSPPPPPTSRVGRPRRSSAAARAAEEADDEEDFDMEVEEAARPPPRSRRKPHAIRRDTVDEDGDVEMKPSTSGPAGEAGPVDEEMEEAGAGPRAGTRGRRQTMEEGDDEPTLSPTGRPQRHRRKPKRNQSSDEGDVPEEPDEGGELPPPLPAPAPKARPQQVEEDEEEYRAPRKVGLESGSSQRTRPALPRIIESPLLPWAPGDLQDCGQKCMCL